MSTCIRAELAAKQSDGADSRKQENNEEPGKLTTTFYITPLTS